MQNGFEQAKIPFLFLLLHSYFISFVGKWFQLICFTPYFHCFGETSRFCAYSLLNLTLTRAVISLLSLCTSNALMRAQVTDYHRGLQSQIILELSIFWNEIWTYDTTFHFLKELRNTNPRYWSSSLALEQSLTGQVRYLYAQRSFTRVDNLKPLWYLKSLCLDIPNASTTVRHQSYCHNLTLL